MSTIKVTPEQLHHVSNQVDQARQQLEHIQENIPPDPNAINITEGGEFLDDAIRMKDQPLEEKPIEENQQTKFQTNKIIYYEHY